MKKRLRRKFYSVLSLLLAVIFMLPTNAVYAFSLEDIVEKVESAVSEYEKNEKEINDFLEKLDMQDISEYYELLSNSDEMLEENFAAIMEECKEQKEIYEEACYETDEFNWLTWGTEMVKAADEASDIIPEQSVKVALIDSGVNFSSDIDVAERKNFIPGHEEISILYEDVSGHGTNIAGVIAAKDNGEGITGVNPKVELYSAKVLDASNCAPISRVVEGIEWAIEKDVNIINISFTTDTNSQELYDVIKKAYDKGILIVAAAGNDGYVAYPAAYPEVIAVGSVNSEGEVSEFSPSSATVELVAPGELITSTDVFDSLSTNSGTSYAAPYVTALASLLWEKDLSCSGNFIRCVLDCSANLYGATENYGYGLVDYQFAEVVYELLKPVAKDSEVFEALMKYAVQICAIYNPTSVPVVSAPDDLVEGAWYAKYVDGSQSEKEYAHRYPLFDFSLKTKNAKALILAGCVLADAKESGLDDMHYNPYFHGYMHYYIDGTLEGDYVDANYLAGGLYLTYVAKAMLSGKNYTTDSEYVKAGDYNLAGMINKDNIDSTDEISWGQVSSQIEYYGSSAKMKDNYKATFDENSNTDKALVIYGLALHSFMDIFAHSAVNPETKKLLIHDNKMNADDTTVIKERYIAAVEVAQNALRQLSRMPEGENVSNANISSYVRIDMSIFDLSDKTCKDKFKLVNFSKYAKQVCNDSELFKTTNDWNDFFDEISIDADKLN